MEQHPLRHSKQCAALVLAGLERGPVEARDGQQWFEDAEHVRDMRRLAAESAAWYHIHLRAFRAWKLAR